MSWQKVVESLGNMHLSTFTHKVLKNLVPPPPPLLSRSQFLNLPVALAFPPTSRGRPERPGAPGGTAQLRGVGLLGDAHRLSNENQSACGKAFEGSLSKGRKKKLFRA